MKQDSHSNLHHHIMGSNNLICFVVIFVVVPFTARCLSRKPTRPCLRFWQQGHITPTFLVCSRRLAQHSWGTWTMHFIFYILNGGLTLDSYCACPAVFALCQPNADLCMCVELPLDKKLWKTRTGPRAVAGRGPWPTGRWAAGLLLGGVR